MMFAEREERIMAIDYGEKRIGIALTDPLKVFAYPFITLINDQTFLPKLKTIITEKNVSKIILGLPSGSNASTINLKNKIEKFKIDIEKKFKLSVTFWNEEYTSVLAKERVLESVSKKKKRRDKSLLDKNSAAIILQEFLNKQ